MGLDLGCRPWWLWLLLGHKLGLRWWLWEELLWL